MPDIKINVGANEGFFKSSINGIASKTSATIKIKAQLDSASAKGFSTGLGKITGEVRQFQESMAAANARVIAFGASTAVLGGLILAFKELTDATIQVEKNLIDINRVFNITQGELEKFSTSLFSISKETASSFADVSKAALEFSRQGLTAEETLKRTQDAMTLVRLTGMDAGKAVESLTAVVNGFNESALDSHSILQKMVAVEQDYSVSALDLTEALSRAGFAAQSAKVSFDELNALVTVAKQNTGRSASVIGEALKTIFTRIERSETLENLERYNITVRDVAGNTLPAVEILKNFSREFAKASDTTKSFLGQQVAGVHQINILKSLVADLSSESGVYSEILRKGTEATNEADIANQRLNESFSALLSQTSTNLQQFASTLGQKEFDGVGKSLLHSLNDQILGPINEALSKDSEGSFGNTIGNGILKGINNVFSGPALMGLALTFVHLAQNSLKYIADILPSLSGLSTETERRKVLEKSIFDILAGESDLSKELEKLSGNRAAQEKLLFDYATGVTVQYEAQAKLAAEIAQSLSGSGVVVSPKIGINVPAKKITTPNLANPIEDAIKREIMAGHDPSTVRVGYDPRLTESGGIGVYNTDEGSLSNAIDMHLKQGMSISEVRNKTSTQNIPNFAGPDDWKNIKKAKLAFEELFDYDAPFSAQKSSPLPQSGYGNISNIYRPWDHIPRETVDRYAKELVTGAKTLSEVTKSIQAAGKLYNLSNSAQEELISEVKKLSKTIDLDKTLLDMLGVSVKSSSGVSLNTLFSDEEIKAIKAKSAAVQADSPESIKNKLLGSNYSGSYDFDSHSDQIRIQRDLEDKYHEYAKSFTYRPENLDPNRNAFLYYESQKAAQSAYEINSAATSREFASHEMPILNHFQSNSNLQARFAKIESERKYNESNLKDYADYMAHLSEESIINDPNQINRLKSSNPYSGKLGSQKSILPSGFYAAPVPKEPILSASSVKGGLNKASDFIDKNQFMLMMGIPMVGGMAEQLISGNKERYEQSYAQRVSSSSISGVSQYAPVGMMLGSAFGPEGAPIGLFLGALAGFVKGLYDANLTLQDFSKNLSESSKQDREQYNNAKEYVEAIKARNSLIADKADPSKISEAEEKIQNSKKRITDNRVLDVIKNYSGNLDDLPKQLQNLKRSYERKDILASIEEGGGLNSIKSAISYSGKNKDLSDLINQQSSLQNKIALGKNNDQGIFGDIVDFIGGPITGRQTESEKIQTSIDKLNEKIAANIVNNLNVEGLTEDHKKSAISKISEILGSNKSNDLEKFLAQVKESFVSPAEKQSGENIQSLTIQRDQLSFSILDLFDKIDDEIRAVKNSSSIQKAVFDFTESISSSIFSPAEKIKHIAEQRNSEASDAYLEKMLAIDKEFLGRYEKVFSSKDFNVSASFFQNKITPALKAASEGDLSQIQDIIKNNSKAGKNDVIGEKDLIELKKSVKEQLSKRSDAKQDLDAAKNLNDTVEKFQRQIQAVESRLSSLSIYQSKQILDNKISNNYSKTLSDLRVDALERYNNRAQNFFGSTVVGEAEAKNRIQDKINQEKLSQLDASTVSSVLPTYLSALKDQTKRLLEQAVDEENKGNSFKAVDLRLQANYLKGKTINSASDISGAISDLQSFSIKDDKDNEKNQTAINALIDAQKTLNSEKQKESEINERIAAENIERAKNSTSFSYNLQAGFSEMNQQSELLIGRLGKDLPTMFADGLTGAIMQATKNAGNIGHALRDAAISFGEEIMSTLLKASLYKGLGSMFGGFDFSSFLGGKQAGGVIKAQNGMYISGNRTGDKNPALLEDGEYVLNREAVKKLGGPSALDNVNFDLAPRFASGGAFSMSLTPYTSEEQAIIQKHNHANRTVAKMMINGKNALINYDDFSGRAFQTDSALGAIRQYSLQQEQQRIQRNLQNAQQNARLISSLVGVAGAVSLSVGIGGLTKAASLGAQAKLANPEQFKGMTDLAAAREVLGGNSSFSAISSLSSDYAKLGFAAPIAGGSIWGYSGLYTINSLGNTVRAGGKQLGGRIGFNSGGYVDDGTRLSDTIPAMLTGGESVLNVQATSKIGVPGINRLNNGTDSIGSTVHNNNNSNNAFNISVNLNKNGAEVIGESGTSYDQRDIVMTQKLANQIKYLAQQTIRDEQRYRGIIQSNQR